MSNRGPTSRPRVAHAIVTWLRMTNPPARGGIPTADQPSTDDIKVIHYLP